jgi:hypothetical protein
MSGIETVFLGFVIGAFAVFGLLLFTLEQSDRRKLGYRSGPKPLNAPMSSPANDAQYRKAA